MANSNAHVKFFLQKILVENAKAIGKKEFSKGNVAYDLTLRYQSSITELGEFNPIKDCVIQPVTFEEVQGVVGYISRNFK